MAGLLSLRRTHPARLDQHTVAFQSVWPFVWLGLIVYVDDLYCKLLVRDVFEWCYRANMHRSSFQNLAHVYARKVDYSLPSSLWYKTDSWQQLFLDNFSGKVYTAVNLACPNFTQPSQATVTPLAKNNLSPAEIIILGVNFVYADFTSSKMW